MIYIDQATLYGVPLSSVHVGHRVNKNYAYCSQECEMFSIFHNCMLYKFASIVLCKIYDFNENNLAKRSN